MYYFIINPKSSSGKGLKIWNKCVSILDSRGVEYQPFFLESPGDATRIAQHIYEALTPCTAVVLGGDGTINEFLTGLPGFEGITFAYIPTGSGNDFARGMALPRSPEDLLNMILDGKKTRDINVGISTSEEKSRSFAVSSGFGFDAAVCHASVSGDLKIKKLLNTLHLGKLIYLVNALRMLFSMKFFRMRVITDDHQQLTFDKVCFAAALNTCYEGGGFMFAPQADPSDDALDVIIAEGLPKWKILILLPTAFFGKHVGHKGIHVFRCRYVDIAGDLPQCVHTDGEHFGFFSKVRFALRPERLKMIVG